MILETFSMDDGLTLNDMFCESIFKHLDGLLRNEFERCHVYTISAFILHGFRTKFERKSCFLASVVKYSSLTRMSDRHFDVIFGNDTAIELISHCVEINSCVLISLGGVTCMAMASTFSSNAEAFKNIEF